MENFHKRLKELLHLRQISVKEFANSIGVQPSTVYSWLRPGRTVPQMRDAAKIAETLNTTCEYLITGNANYIRDLEHMSDIVEYQEQMIRDQQSLIQKQQQMIESLKGKTTTNHNNPLG